MTSNRALVLAFSVFLVSTGMNTKCQAIDIGVARIDITPEGPIRLSGYLVRTAESRGVQQKLWAKALAIGSDAQGAAVLVTVDNLGVPDAITREVAKRLATRAGLAPERLAVSSSHTHSAPCLTNVAPNIFGKPIPADQEARIDQYTRDLTEKLERVCLVALRDRQPGKLAWSQGKVRFAKNRRTNGGPVDHALPVLRANDEQGHVRAMVVGYACHCVTLNPADNLVSGDWAGDAQEAIELDNPGAVAMVTIGCGGDANPDDRGSRNAALRHGRAIAEEVARLVRAPMTPLEAVPNIHLDRVRLPFDTLPTRAQLEELLKKGGPPGYNAITQLARLDRGEPLQSELDYPVQSWRFGDDLAIVFLAGEVVVDYALRLKTELDPARLWVVGYANDVPCYIPSERILKEGGYEGGGAMVYYGRPTRLKPGIEDQIIASVHKQIPASFKKKLAGNKDMPPPRTPDEALRAFRTKPGLVVKVVAAEPLVQSPVAIDFGDDGKLWVAEMRDYPEGIDGQGKPGGQIRFLEDTDGDGRCDRSTLFLDDVPFPTGVVAWRKGVLVCCAPDILYAEDTNADGKADIRKVLYQGFATENFQARVNGLAYGLDNWVYGANGLIGGSIVNPSGKTLPLGGRDFRIKPDLGLIEPASGLTQQGRVHDDWGRQFGGNNSVLLQQYPLPDHYARRNAFVASPPPAVYVPEGPDTQRLYPSSITLERYNNPESANHVTSACSPLIHRDPYLGESYFGNAFTCEPVHNLVHREVLTDDGIILHGHRAKDEQTSEFLTSDDNWFRPVQVRTGPDGSLYVVDMYRFVIEHPRWISPDRLAELDVRAGAKMGRIYRIVREGADPPRVPRLDSLKTPELARALDSPNGTLRDTVQRLLVHRADPSSVSILEDMARRSTRPEVRVQALCTLEGLGALTAESLRAALNDNHPGVRSQAIRLAEPLLRSDPEIGGLIAMVACFEQEPRVRYQLALSLGEWDDPAAGRALALLATEGLANHWITAAVLSSASRRPVEILSYVLTWNKEKNRRPTLLEPLIATLAGSSSETDLMDVVEILTKPEAGATPPWRLAALAALFDASERSSKNASKLAAVLRERPDRFTPAFEAALALARDDKAEVVDRTAAIRLLARHPNGREAELDVLESLLEPRNPAPVQSAAVQALARSRDDRAPARLLKPWPRLGPSLRISVLDVLVTRPVWASHLLKEIERGAIKPGEINAAHRQRLLSLGDDASRARAARLLTSGGDRKRAEIVASYRTAQAGPGDPANGLRLFGKLCAGCHKVAGQGQSVGPDLEALTDTSPEALTIAILDPNREVDARYLNYVASTTDGRVLSGLIASETANAVTLARQDGQSEVLLRSDLEDLKNSGQSLMPEGLERDLTHTDLSDLIAYLNAPKIPKSLPGNRPEMIQPGPDGVVRLSASNASVYGDTLIFEPENQNLGYWQSASDRALWSFKVDRPGVYTVSLEWACADDSAGNTYQIRVGDSVVRRVVGGTGANWANYRSIFVEEVRLKAGDQRLDIRPAGPIRGALFDFRGLTLTPR
jgi:putative membrane-bound dehydrogenase-like protein